jgi:hypothetical protein
MKWFTLSIMFYSFFCLSRLLESDSPPRIEELPALNPCFLRSWDHLALGLSHIPGQLFHKEDMGNTMLYDEISKEPSTIKHNPNHV